MGERQEKEEIVYIRRNELMATQDKCCTIVPYFKVQSDKILDFKGLCRISGS
jgi:hypothetical protein